MKSNTGKNPSKKSSKATPAKTEAALSPAVAKPPTVPVPTPARPSLIKAPAPAPSAQPPVPAKVAVTQPATAAPAAPKAPAPATVAKVSVVAPASPPPAAKEAVVVPPPTPVAIVETPKAPAAPQGVKVTFTLLDPVATRVTLAGEFNNWSPDSLPLKRQGEGLWQTTTALKPGRYQYKFVVDGAWVTDPKATETQCNEFGTLNSVIEVKP